MMAKGMYTMCGEGDEKNSCGGGGGGSGGCGGDGDGVGVGGGQEKNH